MSVLAPPFSRFPAILFLLVAGLALIALGCGGEEPAPTATPRPPAAQPAATATPTPTAVPTSTPAPTAMPAPTSTAAPVVTPTPAAVVLRVSTHDSLGQVLVDDHGRTLYLFFRDEAGVSNCSGGCLGNWPPLLAYGTPSAGDGVAADRIATIARAEGTQQVTYNGWPLYYYVRDASPGDATGQAVGGNWWAVGAYGGPVQTKAKVSTADAGAFGKVLVDSSGRSLYLFTRDAPNVSNCSGNCALNWPPLLTADAPEAAGDARGSLLGTILRPDSTTQVTYNGWPLYYYARDKKPGDVVGQNVGTVWFLLTPDGGVIK